MTASKRLIVHVDESAVGVGKTERAIIRALHLPARWLFAVQRRDAVDELATRMAAHAGAGVEPRIVKIKSDPAQRGFSVRQEVEALPARYENGHVIALCTHEASLMSDLADFHGSISISKVITYPHLPEDDPRYLSSEMRDRLIQQRFAQIERAHAPDIARLAAAGLNDAEF